MKNNGLVFLAFLIICLANLSTHKQDSHAVKAPPPKPELKIAAAPVAIATVSTRPGKG